MYRYIALGVVGVTVGWFAFDFYSDTKSPVVISESPVAGSVLPGVTIATVTNLPLSGSAPTREVPHTIPLEEVRRGCFAQDCIPSVDDPEFVSISEANDILPDDTIGIALSYKGVDRFYPFNMLVTREIVNDVVADDPLLITYCPLCGTGIVFDRKLGGQAVEFGVSGMLWQSNLLMYNRADAIADRNLWSQVLGQAVVGARAGQSLDIVPSDIAQYTTWRENYPEGSVLNTGRIGDPYNGQYYQVARNFSPNFDETQSQLNPSAYVYGIVVNGQPKAYAEADIPLGVTEDSVGLETVIITRTDNQVAFTNESGSIISDIEGFWFSWQAAHPQTDIWNP